MLETFPSHFLEESAQLAAGHELVKGLVELPGALFGIVKEVSRALVAFTLPIIMWIMLRFGALDGAWRAACEHI